MLAPWAQDAYLLPMSYVLFGRRPRGAGPLTPERPDWVAADPRRIEAAVDRARDKPGGGWAVLDAARRIETPRRFEVAGRELVAWRAPNGRLLAADEACPHMGASLCGARRDARGRLLCPWHGRAIGGAIEAYDDGVLAWVRLGELLAPTEPATGRPILPRRPAAPFFDGVVRVEARCAPADVIANRLDPWHGVHLHPHSFLRLSVVSEDVDQITVRVVYRVLGPLAMEVDARFTCPDPRTVVMTIVDGDGIGSVVETHATPLGEGRTAIVEATLATSDRSRFGWATRARALVRPFIERRAARLWDEDREYAERRASRRRRGGGEAATKTSHRRTRS